MRWHAEEEWLTDKGAEYDEADHIKTEQNYIIQVGDDPVSCIAEAMHLHHHPNIILLLVYYSGEHHLMHQAYWDLLTASIGLSEYGSLLRRAEHNFWLTEILHLGIECSETKMD